MPLNEGQVLAGKYRIEKLLGEGGMGSVFVAVNTVLQKKVALKVMSSRFASMPAAVERFQREAIAASRVSHPSIVQVFDAGQHEGAPWIAMEMLAGESLGDRLERGPLSVEETLRMAEGSLSALAEVHEEGIVHRDLKPDNIFLASNKSGDWIPKVLDFGIAKDTNENQLSKLTATGAVVGTAYYLSPEQAKGLPDIDARADVYAMGVVLFECLSGDMPYEAETITQLIAKMFTEPPRKLSDVAPHIPAPIADVVTTCLEQDRTQRFQTARALLGAMRSAAEAIGASTGFGNVAPSNPGLAATGHAMGAGRVDAGAATGMGHPGLASGPGVQSNPGMHPGSQPGYPGGPPDVQPGSQPGVPGGYSQQPGVQSQPGAYSQPGMQHMHPPGSAPGIPGTAVGPASMTPIQQPGRMLGTAVIPAGMGLGSYPGTPGMPQAHAPSGQMAHVAPPRKGKAGWIVLVMLLFLLGAGGTGAAVYFLGQQDDSGSVALANSEGSDEPEPPPTDEVNTASAPPTLEPATDDPAVPPTDPVLAATNDGAEDATPRTPTRTRHHRDRQGDRHGDRHGDREEEPPSPPPQPEPRALPGVGQAQPVSPPTQPAVQPPVRPPTPPPQDSEGLSQSQIGRTIAQRTVQNARRCFERARNPNLRGIVTVDFHIQPSGQVDRTRIIVNNTGDDRIGRCVEQFVRATQFPSASNNRGSNSRYPFRYP